MAGVLYPPKGGVLLHGLLFIAALSAANPGSPVLAQAAPAPAPSAQNKEEARRAFKEGDEAFKAGDFDVALKDFTKAYELSHLGELLFDIALCHRALGNWADARDYYNRYLTEVPNGKSRELAVTQLAEVKQKLAETEAAKTPPPNLQPTQQPVTEVAATTKPASHPSTAAIILGSVGIAATVVAVVGLVEVLSYHNPTVPTDINKVSSDVNNANTWATISLISGITAVAGFSGAALTW
jgi:tetratricopeptide (TPR) repeat protein